MNNNTTTSTALEGIGAAPVHVDRPNLDGIDPTLEACCRREQEDQRKSAALKRTLQRHDIVAERERRRRNILNCSSFDGCRCRYDPTQDGGEYAALTELRRRLQQGNNNIDGAGGQQQQQANNKNDIFEEKDSFQDEKKKSNDDSDDDDSEFDYLLDEDLPGGQNNQELKLLQEARRAELEWEMLQRETAVQHGYGVHRQMHPTRVLRAAGIIVVDDMNATSNKNSRRSRDESSLLLPAVVLHLYDPENMASASLDLCLEDLATRTRGTVFLRSHGRGTLLTNPGCKDKLFSKRLTGGSSRHHADGASSVVDSLLPALIAIRDGVAVHACPRLQGLVEDERSLSSTRRVVPEAVHQWLRQAGVLRDEPPSSSAVNNNNNSICHIRPEEEALLDNLRNLNMNNKREEEEEQFDCGVEGCCKYFRHEHVGIRNEQQCGLIVPEEQVLGTGTTE